MRCVAQLWRSMCGLTLRPISWKRSLTICQTRIRVRCCPCLLPGKSQSESRLQFSRHQRTEDEALRDFLWRHRRFDGLNDFTRLELGRDLKSFFREKARLNQQAGGQRKGSAKLEASERVDSRKERAQSLGVSEGNVSKVDRILEHACSSTKQAARDKEISIHRADQWSRETEAQQIENLRVLRIEQGIRKKARNLVAEVLASKPDEGVLTTAHLLRLLQRLSTMSPEQSKEFGPIVTGRLNVPWKAIYVTDELIQARKPQQEVLIK
jgi:hypothetical protein